MSSLLTPGRIFAALIILVIVGWLSNGHMDAFLADAVHQTLGHTLNTLNDPLAAYRNYR